jgi:hypothetical protein
MAVAAAAVAGRWSRDAAAAGYSLAGCRGMGQWQQKWMEVGAGWRSRSGEY